MTRMNWMAAAWNVIRTNVTHYDNENLSTKTAKKNYLLQRFLTDWK